MTWIDRLTDTTRKNRRAESNERLACAIAERVAEKCQGNRKPGQAPERYAIIYQAARLGALEAFKEQAE